MYFYNLLFKRISQYSLLLLLVLFVMSALERIDPIINWSASALSFVQMQIITSMVWARCTTVRFVFVCWCVRCNAHINYSIAEQLLAIVIAIMFWCSRVQCSKSMHNIKLMNERFFRFIFLLFQINMQYHIITHNSNNSNKKTTKQHRNNRAIGLVC